MTNADSTRFKPIMLPTSQHELTAIDCLHFVQPGLLDSILITPPSDWTAFGPEGDLFRYPIQITVLGFDQASVQLGLYVNPCLTLLQGPKPSLPWRLEWADVMGIGITQPRT